jgi:hypothetical protein
MKPCLCPEDRMFKSRKAGQILMAFGMDVVPLRSTENFQFPTISNKNMATNEVVTWDSH